MSTATDLPRVADLIAEELADLGDEPDRVADVLFVTGSRGRRRDAAANPITLYLCRRVRLDGAVRIRPGSHCLEVSAGEAGDFLLPLVEPVRAFLDRFDGGQYPELEGQ